MSLGPPDLAATVSSFSFAVTRRRYTAPSVMSSGLVRSTGYTDATIRAHVHDAPADVLERVFPGQEGVRAIQFYTSEADLRVPSVPNQRADVLLFRNREFEVVEVAEWNAGASGSRSYLAGIAREVTR